MVMDSLVMAEQPMPAFLAEACGWLLAAEGNVGKSLDSDDIVSAIDAGDALDVLLDVRPPYSPVRQPVRQVAVSVAIAKARAALERAAGEATTVEQRLRIARAVYVLRGAADQ
jgi:hypothetical protein